MKQREFYFYNTGPEQSFKLITGCREEVKQFEEKNTTLGYNAKKFGDESMIVPSIRQVAAINEEIAIMQETWEHI